MIQTVEYIIIRFCAYGMEYKDHKGYTHDWVTLLPAVQLDYNKSQHSTTGRFPSLVEKGWNPLLPVEHLKKILLTIHPTAKDFHDMWRRACNRAGKCIAEAKEYKKQSWDKSHMKPDFTEGDQVLVSTLKFNNLIGPQKMRDSFVGPFTIIKPSIPNIVKMEACPGPVKKIIKAINIRLNGKYQSQYLVRFKHQTADKDKWLAEEAIPDGNDHPRRFITSRRTNQSHQ
ncbi:hypothetical protein O181_034975 [Austropuccinia psidii MF-1]|uniref:Integrase catalytic domain-containing protein n=1 Tax=Austropuccinia psidii MF-1 TaxID=1389203 RepID=A0A9Q3D619_9BASI|nr:hypothetical protein [Austropuccinia psidii MF-1]